MIDTPEKAENITFAEVSGTPCPPPKGITPRPGQIVCGDVDIRINAEGAWFHNGSPITRKKLVQLFATVVRRDEAGDYWLITPAEMARIKVDDAPFLAVEMLETNDNGVRYLKFRTNVDSWITADANHPIRVAIAPNSGEPRPYLRLFEDGTEARINRAVFYELVNNAVVAEVDGRSMLTIDSAGEFFILGPASE
ncbi:MAG: DUF1285 domain-containing protein [Rhodospirillales bacterium]|nr:DUF1285 domain-containing protein [Rhodospirillales bacterium]